MKSVIRECRFILPLAIAIGLAVPSLSGACQAEYLQIVATSHVSVDAKAAGESADRMTTPTPQYPIKLIGFDGVTYTYQSDCCQMDRHTGLIYSNEELTELGCGSTGVEGVEIALSNETFGNPNPGQTLDSITVCMHSSFANAIATPFKPVSSRGDAGTLSDYYGGRSSAATAVQLTGNDGVSRFYTLMRVETFGNFNVDGKSEGFRYELPVLYLARTTATRNVDFGARQPQDVTPEKTITVADAVAVDLTAAGVQVVTVKLPDPTSGDLKDVKCLLVNRKVDSIEVPAGG